MKNCMRLSIQKKCKKIRLVISDVDGVLTDGGMYYTSNGDVMKKFHTRDGMGVTLLRKHKIPTIIVTKEKTKTVKQWAKKMKIGKLYDDVIQKELIFDQICNKFHVRPEQVAYIGDDVNDIKLLKKVGFSAVPYDAIKEVKKVSDYICKVKSGEGVLREVADLILSS